MCSFILIIRLAEIDFAKKIEFVLDFRFSFDGLPYNVGQTWRNSSKLTKILSDKIWSPTKNYVQNKIWMNNKFYFLDNRFSFFFLLYLLQ